MREVAFVCSKWLKFVGSGLKRHDKWLPCVWNDLNKWEMTLKCGKELNFGGKCLRRMWEIVEND